MVTNQKGSGRAASIPVSTAFGVLAAVVWTWVTAMITAKMIEIESIDESMIGYCSMGILLTSGMIGSWIAYKKAKHHRIQVSALTAAGYYLSLLAITALFFDGQYTGMGVTALLIAGGSMAYALLGSGNRGSRNKKTYPKIKK